MYVCKYVCMYVCVCVYVYMYVCVCVCMYVYMYVCMCVCIRVWRYYSCIFIRDSRTAYNKPPSLKTVSSACVCTVYRGPVFVTPCLIRTLPVCSISRKTDCYLFVYKLTVNFDVRTSKLRSFVPRRYSCGQTFAQCWDIDDTGAYNVIRR
jgi:hypothetical protein